MRDRTDYYRLLGLRDGASLSQIKASYRQLARRYHPDVNPGDESAQLKFMAITEAYKFLLSIVPRDLPEMSVSDRENSGISTGEGGVKVRKNVSNPGGNVVNHSGSKMGPRLEYESNLSDLERKLKRDSYTQLQSLFSGQKFPRAIALVEGLAQRIPQDREVRQWQAITYQRWARKLIEEKQVDKARIYLKKALKTDPHNRTLWAEVEKDFRSLEKIY